MTPRASRVDLPAGELVLTDGQRVPITKYFGPPDEAPADGEDVKGFDWVKFVVAGPDADGNWLAVEVTDEDRNDG
jgi:hypothetical protein